MNNQFDLRNYLAEGGINGALLREEQEVLETQFINEGRALLAEEDQMLFEEFEELVKKLTAKALKVKPEDVPEEGDKEGEDYKIKKEGEEVEKGEINEVAVLTAVTIAGLIPPVLELIGGLINKINKRFNLTDEQKKRYAELVDLIKKAKEAGNAEEEEKLKKELEPLQKGGAWKEAGHSLHKLYTWPIRTLLKGISWGTDKGSKLRDPKYREKVANIIYGIIMASVAGYGIYSHIGHLAGIGPISATLADVAKGTVSVKDAITNALSAAA